MRRILGVALVLAWLAPGAPAQDAGSVIVTYQRNFVRSSLATKLELLKEAGKAAATDMGPLYDTALRFVLDNAGLLAGDAQLRDLALLAVKKSGESAWTGAADHIWSVFQVYAGDSELRAAAIAAYARAGSAFPRMISDINSFLASQNTLFRSGVQPEYPGLEAAIDAVGNIADPASYPVLFSTYVAGYNPLIKSKASASLGKIRGEYRAFLEAIVMKNSVLEKAAALDLGLAPGGLGPDDQARLAETALGAALDWKGDSPLELSVLRQLRVTAVREIRDSRWQRAAALAIRHFRGLLADYNDGKGAEVDLLEAISCLGAMGSTDAAQALSLYLQLINAQTEQGKPYDEALLLAVIGALGDLGDKVAFDYLLYIGYLQYPESVKEAAKDALQRLKW
jgi:hypothetical protein